MIFLKNILYKITGKHSIRLFKSQTIFPYYHIVSNEDPKHVKHLYTFKNTDQFKKDIDQLLKHFKPLSPEFFINNPDHISLPKNSFLLSFDDGLAEVYHYIFPILKEKKIKAIFFINPNFIDNRQGFYKHEISLIIEALKNSNNAIRLKISEILKTVDYSEAHLKQHINKLKQEETPLIKEISIVLDIDFDTYIKTQKPYLSKEQIQEMIQEGFYFGGHTLSHPRLLDISIADQKREVISSLIWLKNNLNITYNFFAFPFYDKGISKNLITSIFKHDEKTIIFGNSGIKKDISSRIIQRFSLESPETEANKEIVYKNLVKYLNKALGKYRIKRK